MSRRHNQTNKAKRKRKQKHTQTIDSAAMEHAKQGMATRIMLTTMGILPPCQTEPTQKDIQYHLDRKKQKPKEVHNPVHESLQKEAWQEVMAGQHDHEPEPDMTIDELFHSASYSVGICRCNHHVIKCVGCGYVVCQNCDMPPLACSCPRVKFTGQVYDNSVQEAGR